MAISLTRDLLREALNLHRRGDSAGAAAGYANVLRLDPGNADAPYYLGLMSCHHGRFAEGADYARRAITNDPEHARGFVLLGRALTALKRGEEALENFDRAIALAPDFAQAYGHHADVLSELGHYAEAIDSYDRALALAPDAVEDWFNRGAALFAVERYDDALASFDRVLAHKPDFSDACLWRSKVLSELHRYDEALAGVEILLANQPTLAEAWVGRGNVLNGLSRRQDAFASYDKALVLNPNAAEAWLGRANLCIEINQNDEALAAYDRALALKQDLAEAWAGRGNLLTRLRRYQEALASFDKAFALNSDLKHLAGLRIHVKQHLCDWTDLFAEIERVIQTTSVGKPSSAPFPLLAMPTSAESQLQCARRYIAGQPAFQPIWRGEIYSHDRIRVAYLSADLHEHATAYLAAGLFEQHDRARYEVTALSFGPDDQSPMRARLRHAFERFLDVRDRTDEEVAQLMRRLEIDIAVDLKGLTENCRLGILARRAAPIQVSYLGYPATMGADFIDYILADETVIPEEDRAFYSEQVVWLPDSYQINDDRRVIAEAAPSRCQCSLPEAGFVFCCFNNSYKIAPEIFDLWMRLLQTTENSVLWLWDSAAAANLREEAARRGVSAERLIFAPRMKLADHLARHRHADLFLDTLPCNAHTTASDALWAGVPVLTCLGATFTGRVAASLLKAVGLEALITQSLNDYEALALKLAHNPSVLKALRSTLAQNKTTFPLFDTRRTTRQIEAAYTMMWQRYQWGQVAKPRGDANPIRFT